ncbi:MAG: hypothetical protein M5U26_12580 [Planctomycetota bacterium]|nr:hypothetical protein [Planctomycetota bacterium]
MLLLVFMFGSKFFGSQSPAPTEKPKANPTAKERVSAPPPAKHPASKAPSKPETPNPEVPPKAVAPSSEAPKSPESTVPSDLDPLEVARKAQEEWKKNKELEKARAEAAEREAALAIASSSSVGSRIDKETVQVPAGPAERVYFKGFETPSYSQEERATRYNWLQRTYPYEDEAERRYKIVQKTEPKEVERTLTTVSFVNRGGRTLSGAMVILSTAPISGAPVRLPLGSVSAIPIDPLGVGESWMKEAQARPGTTLNYYLVYPGADNNRAYWIPLGAKEAQAFPVSSDIAKAARQVCEATANAAQGGEPTPTPANWRQNKIEVATRYVQALLGDGTLISARRQPDADTVADIAFEFTFRTQAGITRTRLGYVYVEPGTDGWSVHAVNIDGRRMPAND